MVGASVETRSARAMRESEIGQTNAAPRRELVPAALGCVYGVILNSASQAQALEPDFHKPPYAAPPRAPVLYVKSPNTYLADGGIVGVPEGVERLEVNAVLGVVFGETVSRASRVDALRGVLGYTVAIDVCVPHASLYRPAVRQRCRDSFLPVAPWLMERAGVANPDLLETVVAINGVERRRYAFSDIVRPTAELIAAISEFQSFHAGDMLLVGLAPDGAQARTGDRVSASIEGVGRVDCRLGAEAWDV